MTTIDPDAALALFGADILPARGPVTRPAYYRTAIAARMETITFRSWDAYVDVFGPAYDDTEAATHDMNECVAVAVAYVAYVLGEEPPAQLRALIARGIRSHGKAMLYGYDQALAVIADDPSAIHRYALKVARRIVTEAKEHTP